MFLKYNVLDEINDKLKILSDLQMSDMHINDSEKEKLSETLLGFTQSLKNEIITFEKRYSLDIFKTIFSCSAVVLLLIYLVNLKIQDSKNTYNEYRSYISYCSNGNVAKCSEGISFIGDKNDKQNLALAYKNATGKALKTILVEDETN